MKSSDPDADLFSISSGSFSEEDRQKIRTEAESRFQRQLKLGIDPEQAWRETVVDFHRNSYWGFEFKPGKKSGWDPVVQFPKLNSNFVRDRAARRFFWIALQSLVIMKGVIMYFGLNYSTQSAENESPFGGGQTSIYGWGLAISVLISFGGLIWFAIRQSRSNYWD